MKLKSFNYLLGLSIIFFNSLLFSEEKVDIWKNNKETVNETTQIDEKRTQETSNPSLSTRIKATDKIQIQEGSSIQLEEQKVYGIYDPANYDFNLNMWSTTKATDLRSSLKRLNKIELSKSSSEILEAILLSFSYPPQGMTEKEFVDLKINWLIENDRLDLIESFLKQNDQFESKSKAVEYLVNKNIASGNIKEGCEKVRFIDAKIKDAYLEKFKIYCLVFNDKKPEAQLLLNLLREQKQSNNFYDDKINFLLGVTDKTTNKINEENLLNFYLSAVTIVNFKYEPTKKTKPEIWTYLNADNLIKLEDASDKGKLKELEIAANNDQLDKNKIFEIYKQIPFNLNTLINAKNIVLCSELLRSPHFLRPRRCVFPNSQEEEKCNDSQVPFCLLAWQRRRPTVLSKPLRYSYRNRQFRHRNRIRSSEPLHLHLQRRYVLSRCPQGRVVPALHLARLADGS